MSDDKQKKGIVRNFGISTWAINNRTSVFVVVTIILIMGMFSYNQMPKENFPEINIPQIYVGTVYPGNSPLDMENLITRPIEKEINSINGVTALTSTSIQDYSTVLVEFSFDVDVQEALLDVKEAVDKAELPTDLDTDPDVFELDFSEIPIVNINLSGEEYSLDDLKFYAEYLQDEIEDLSEISKVELRGALEKEVKIEVDKYKMELLKLSFGDIKDAIKYENKTISGGDILTDEFRRTIRIEGEFESIDDLDEVIVKHDYQQVVYLKDIADISFGPTEATSYSRISGSPVITLEVKKKGGENLLHAADQIKEIVADAKKNKLPKDLTVAITNDTSRITRSSVDNLENSIISGVILVVVVLLFFLGLRNAMFVGIAIPLSMLLGFMMLGFTGQTMNMVVLFSLILALGMLVDNGIVVVENIYRLMQEGYSPSRAAKEGVGEVAWPIITSTATTLAAFFPLLFWDDIMGEFMKYLPITLIIVLSSSLFVALVINPVFTSVFMKVQTRDTHEKKTGTTWIVVGLMIALAVICYIFAFAHVKTWFILANLLSIVAVIIIVNTYILTPISYWFQEKFLPFLEKGYYALIRFALKGWRPGFFFVAMFFLAFLSMSAYFGSNPEIVNFPEANPNYINVFIELPTGTDITKTNKYAKMVENEVMNTVEKYMGENGDENIESILTNIGEGTTDPNSPESVGAGASPNKAKIVISFVEFQHRTLPKGTTTEDILDEVREVVAQFPGASINAAKEANGPPSGPPINIEVSGEDFDELIALSNDVMKFVNDSEVKGIEGLNIDLDVGKPELLVDINREAAQTYGLSTSQVAGALRTALFGSEVSKFKEGEDEYPIMVRLKDEQRYDLESLLNQKISFKDRASGKNIQVPISAIADVEYTTTYGAVRRREMDRVVTIYSNVLSGYNANKIIEEITILLEDFDIPDGYDVKFTGEFQEQQKSMEFLMTAFIIAVFLILLIIITQFNSITSPLIILLSVFFSTIGVFIGLTITGADFVVIMTGIGIISLAGVVVNNAIVLIDYINLLRERKKEEMGLAPNRRLPKEELVEVIMEAGKTRLRPVLLTAITTVLGLIPLAIGFNINFFTLLSDFDPQIFIGGDNVSFWGPMSKTIIYGLTFATFLTLVIIPVMYLIFDRVGARVSRLFK